MSFEKGHKKVGGRVAGTPNKSRELADRILKYANKRNIEKDLEALYKLSPSKYFDFIGRLLPKQVELSGSEDGEPVQFVIRGVNDKGNTGTTA